VTFALGVAAVARTVGLAFDYRLRWTYIPAMIGAAVIGWAGWTAAAERWPRAGSRVLTPTALAALAVVGGVNVVTAATAGTPQNDDSAAMASLTDQVLDNLPETDGTVLVTDSYYAGAWHARGLVLQLERHGIDVGVEAARANEYGRHRVVGSRAEVGTALVVTRDEYVDEIAARPGMRMIAEWYSRPRAEIDELVSQREQIDAEVEAGRLTPVEASRRQAAIGSQLTNDEASLAYHAAVFIDEGFGDPAAPAG
jgi:hypothetical protein